jgi:CHAT domain-containing protein
LIEDYVVTYAPSAYLLKVSQEREYQKARQPRALVVGDPQPLAGVLPLAFAAEEARTAAKQLRRVGWTVDELIGTKATKQRFLDGDQQGVAGINSGAYSHLHLAQHAGLGGREHQAHFYFGCPRQGIDPSEYLCSDREIAVAPLQQTESVVAATCVSSVTDPSLNEYLGIGASFLQAGVGTFIGTIYPLSDEGSSKLVPELYRLRLQEGLSWADALRRAQLQMAGVVASGASRDARQASTTGKTLGLLEKLLKTPEPSEKDRIPLDHPHHWAAFTASGKE